MLASYKCHAKWSWVCGIEIWVEVYNYKQSGQWNPQGENDFSKWCSICLTWLEYIMNNEYQILLFSLLLYTIPINILETLSFKKLFYICYTIRLSWNSYDVGGSRSTSVWARGKLKCEVKLPS